jgi:hypothetical protein
LTVFCAVVASEREFPLVFQRLYGTEHLGFNGDFGDTPVNCPQRWIPHREVELQCHFRTSIGKRSAAAREVGDLSGSDR